MALLRCLFTVRKRDCPCTMGGVEEMEGGMVKVVRDREEMVTFGIGRSRIFLEGSAVDDAFVAVATFGGEEGEGGEEEEDMDAL